MEKELYFLPSEKMEFKFREYPAVKEELEKNEVEILKRTDENANLPTDCFLVKSQICKNKYYCVDEFEKKNAESVAELIARILINMGATKVNTRVTHNIEQNLEQKSENHYGAGGKYKKIGASAEYNTNESLAKNDKNEKIETISFELSKENRTKEELQKFIDEKQIDIEKLPSWLKVLVEEFLENGRKIEKLKTEYIVLESIENIKQLSRELKGGVKLPAVFEAKLKAQFEKFEKIRKTEYKKIEYEVEF